VENVPEPELALVLNRSLAVVGYTVANDVSSCDIEGATSTARLNRSFAALCGYLGRSQRFPVGAILLTGTGVVPPDDFTLAAGDQVDIRIDRVGELTNSVVVVPL
jgi:fumarylacetoacetate (FAA) hydrolase family protein